MYKSNELTEIQQLAE